MGKDDILLEQICGDSYIKVNRAMIQKYGPVEAILLSDMIQKRAYFRSRGELVNGEYFFFKREDIERYLKISIFVQRNIFKDFIKKGLVETANLSNSRATMLYYKINSSLIINELRNNWDREVL